jgi:glycosyltransferase involved in cell wall biosynthesis
MTETNPAAGKPNRVCMLTYSFYENDGRVKRYAEALAARGEPVDVIALRKPDKAYTEIINGVTVYRIQERAIDERGAVSYLTKLLRFLIHSAVFLSRRHWAHPYRLIHVHSIPDFEVFAALLPKLLGAKIILDIHDIVPELYVSKFASKPDGLLFKALVLVEKLACGFSDHVIISNHIWEERLVKRSVRPGKCTTVLNYPDAAIFNPRPRTRQDDKTVLLYPGTMNWHQGLDIAITAFGKISAAHPNAELHIYGQGSELPNLKAQAGDAGLEERVRFFPAVSIDQVAQIMADADIGIIPKRNDPFGGDAFSTKSLEFMSVGIPVIMSATRIDRYYFNDSVVRFFEPENADSLAAAMDEMITGAEQRGRLAAAALEFVREFSWSRKRETYLAIVDRLLEAGANR